MPSRTEPSLTLALVVKHLAYGAVERRLGRVEEATNEVPLSLSRNLRRAAQRDVPVGVCYCRLLHDEQTHVHAALGGHVLPAAIFHEVAVSAKPREQAVLPDVDTIGSQQLCQLANQHGVVGCRHRVGEQRLRRKLAVFCLKLLALGALLLEVGGKADDGVGVGQRLLHLLRREVAAMFADGRQDGGENPRFELLRIGKL